MPKLNLFVPITKVDEDKRLVYGVVTEEVVDKANEIFDYAGSKPYFEKWSDMAQKATGGKSSGNLRVMHTSKVAGKLTELNFDDENLRIEACAKVVDDDEWAKVLEGCYTGFSMGGKYVSRAADKVVKGATRFVANPAEVSLVDNPCVPTAHFEVVKADGQVLQKNFVVWAPDNKDVANRAVELAKAAGSETRWPGFVEEARELLVREHVEKAGSVAEGSAADEEDDGVDGTNANETAGGTSKGKKAKVKTKKADGTLEDEVTEVDEADFDANKMVKVDEEPSPEPAPVVDATKRHNDELGLRQVWLAPDGTTHASKADAAKHVAGQADPVEAALAKAQAALKGEKQPRAAKFGDDLSTEAAIRAAWGHLCDPEARKGLGLTDEQVTVLRSSVTDAWVAKISPDGPPSAERMEAVSALDMAQLVKLAGAVNDQLVQKGMYTVSRLADCLSCLASVACSTVYEERYENDTSSKLPQMGADLVAAMRTFLIEMVTEETAELLAELKTGGGDVIEVVVAGDDAVIIEASAKITDLVKADEALVQKAGARNSSKDKARIQAVHDHSVGLGADCKADKAAAGDEVTKMATLEQENTRLSGQVEKALAGIETLTTEIEKLRNEPAPGGPARIDSSVVHKNEDKRPGAAPPASALEELLSKYTPTQLSDMMIRLSHSSGGRTLLDRGT